MIDLHPTKDTMTIFHVAMTKSYLRRQVRCFGPGPVIGREDLSVDSATAAIDADPRSHFIIGECDNQQGDGSCGGHHELNHTKD